MSKSQKRGRKRGAAADSRDQVLAKKTTKIPRHRKLNATLIVQGMLSRIVQRIAITGQLRLPAVPALVEEYVRLCINVFAAGGRGFDAAELAVARRVNAEALQTAFVASPRSKVDILFEAEPARPLGFEVKPDVRSIADAYERWIGTTEGPLFGAHPDARVMSLAAAHPEPCCCPVLDFGAGTGRNALALARRGHPVDAVEITPKFAELLADAALSKDLSVRVIAQDVFRDASALRSDYGLFLASEVVPDFRGVAELRRLFALAAAVLSNTGILVFNVHLCAQGYNPDKAARELAQQCYSSLFTPGEVMQAFAGLPFELIANDSTHDFEKEHLPATAWPPTAWYVNWTTGLDVFEIEPKNCPIELRWLVFRKVDDAVAVPEMALQSTANGLAPLTPDSSLSPMLESLSPECSAPSSPMSPLLSVTRPQRFDAAKLRKALALRLSRRLGGTGTLTFPAIPGMTEQYTAMCIKLFRALGRDVGSDRTAVFQQQLGSMLQQAFTESQRSNVVVTFETKLGNDLKYTIVADPVPLADAYQRWSETSSEPMFGTHPDARLVELVATISDAERCPILDVGAGLGRNATYLAARGHPVDAVELTPVFAASLADEARRRQLPIRALAKDFFDCIEELRRDYRFMVVSGTLGDFRDVEQLRRLFEVAAERLVDGGLLLLGLHVAADETVVDDVARQWAQQCCAMFFTRGEIERAVTGLPLVLQSDDSAYDYERAHQPELAWPPSAVFCEWATGRHLYDLERDQLPIELRWLVLAKCQPQ